MPKGKEWSPEKKKFVRGLAYVLSQNPDMETLKCFQELRPLSPIESGMSVDEAEKALTKYFS